MNIWNPQVMTENDIYETCDDVLGTENHYCTPVPTQNNGLSSVTSRTALTQPLPGNPIRRHGLGWKSSAAILLGVIIILVLVTLLACSGFALSEVSRLQSEMNGLKREIASLRDMGQSNMADLSLLITQEESRREMQLTSLAESLDSMVTNLSNSTAVDIVQLESRLQADLDTLREVLSANLSSVANVSASQYMLLTLSLNSSFSAFSDEFDRFQSDYQANVRRIEENMEAQSEDINKTNMAVNMLAVTITDDLGYLNFSVALKFELVQAEMGNLSSIIQNAIDDAQNTTLEEISKMRSDYTASISRIEGTMEENVRYLEGRIALTEYHAMSNLSVVKDSVNSSLFDLRTLVRTSVSSLRAELDVVEYELSLATHANITSLGVNFQTELVTALNEVRVNFTQLERMTGERITTLSNSTGRDLRDLHLETQSNLTELVMVTQREIHNAFHASQTQVDQLEASVLANFTRISLLITDNTFELETLFNATVNTLESHISATSTELSRLLSQLQGEVLNNVTNLLSMIEMVNSSYRADITEAKNELVFLIHTNVSLLESSTSVTFTSLKNMFAGNISSLELTTHNLIDDLANQSSQNFSTLQTEIHSTFLQLSESTVSNITSLETRTVALLDGFHDDLVRNLSRLRVDAARELNITRFLLEFRISRGENDTLEKIRELQVRDNLTTILVEELDLQISQNFSDLLIEIAQNLTRLSSDIHLELNHLNRTDSDIIAMAHDTEEAINEIYSHNNETRRSIEVIETDVSNLTTASLLHGVEISSIKNDLKASEKLTNLTFSELRLDIETAVEESSTNFSIFYNLTKERLDYIFEDVRSNLVNLESQSSRNITNLRSNVDSIVQSLEQNFTDNILSLESKVRANISDLEIETNSSLLQLNSSLGIKLETLSRETEESFTGLMQALNNETRRLSGFINTSIQMLGNDNAFLLQEIDNISAVVNLITVDIAALSVELNATRENFRNYQQNITHEIQDIQESHEALGTRLSVNFEIALNSSLQLRQAVDNNLTAVRNQLSTSIQELENHTLMLASDFNSSFSQLYLNTTQSRTELLDSIRRTKELLFARTGNLSSEVEVGFRLLTESVSWNFTTLRVQLNTVITNTSAAYEELDGRMINQLMVTNGSLYALDAALNNLVQFAEQLDNNVSSVSNEVKQIGAEFDNFTSSPLNIYDGCLEESTECDLVSAPNYHAGSCTTPTMPINATVCVCNFYLFLLLQ